MTIDFDLVRVTPQRRRTLQLWAVEQRLKGMAEEDIEQVIYALQLGSLPKLKADPE